MTRPAIVESISDHALREINALEGRIVKAEDDADSMLWEQARRVVEQLDAGLSQRQLAAQWTNIRTGKPYSQTHVVWTRRAFEQFTNHVPRPRFRDAYNAHSNYARKALERQQAATVDPGCNRSTQLVNVTCDDATQFVNRLCSVFPSLLRPVLTDEPDLDVNIDGLPDEVIEAMESVVYARLDAARIPAWVATLRKTAHDLTRFAARLERETALRERRTVLEDSNETASVKQSRGRS